MDIISTIIPIFTIILIGYIVFRQGIVQAEFIPPANRIVYYLAIPAMIFKAVSQTDFQADFNILVVGIAMAAMVVAFVLSWLIGRMCAFQTGHLSTFIQSGYHCNIGYIALAVAYYYLGNAGLARTGMVAGFLMMLQNFLSVAILSFYAKEQTLFGKRFQIALKIFGNPIILAAAAGMAFSLLNIRLPIIFQRSLDILSGLALPMALLIIGASLSFRLIQHHFFSLVWTAGVMKLVLLPGLAYGAYGFFHVPTAEFLPAIILLSSPTATVTYVMAKEIGGDMDFAVAAISVSTLLSAVTFSAWLKFLV